MGGALQRICDFLAVAGGAACTSPANWCRVVAELKERIHMIGGGLPACEVIPTVTQFTPFRDRQPSKAVLLSTLGVEGFAN